MADRTATLAACCGDAAADLDALAALLPILRGETAVLPASCALASWLAWGVGDLTGRTGMTPLAPRSPVACRVETAIAILTAITARWGSGVDLDPSALLVARARESGFGRGGEISANGFCHLLETDVGWAAINLARSNDVVAAAALLGCLPTDLVDLLRVALRTRGSELLPVLQSLEVPVALLGSARHASPLQLRRLAPAGPVAPPVVVDFSAMWAGPLCASILSRAGAEVIKIEDPDRPDGARFGAPAFFANLHAGEQLQLIHLRDKADRGRLNCLLARADVVIESSRPRALRQLGIDAEAFVSARPGRTWISVTGYGRTGDSADRVAFGDDAAVAAGLVAYDADGPVFCGDAIADPLAGLYAGLAAAASIAAGGGHLIEVSMAGVCAHVNRSGDGRQVRDHRLVASGGSYHCEHVAEAPC